MNENRAEAKTSAFFISDSRDFQARLVETGALGNRGYGESNKWQKSF
jgi:hypothetical protein